MATELSNHFKAELLKGNIDFENDTIKCMLMDTGFTFDIDADALYSNVSTDELANGNGYTTGGITMGAATVTEDDTNDRGGITFADFGSYAKSAGWTASGGSIGPSPGAILYDTTASSTVIGFIDFSTDQTATDGNDFTIDDIFVRLT